MINFNANPSSDKYTPAPDGDYFLTVVEAEEKKAKSGRDMIVLDLVIALGPCEGKPMRHYLTFIEEDADGNADVVKVAFGHLATCWRAGEVLLVFPASPP